MLDLVSGCRTRKGSGEVETQRFERLVEVMARMAGGDQAAVFTLYLEYGDHVAALMRRELRRLGVQHVEPDELDGLVLNGCLALLDGAGAWDPEGGALPWNWAVKRLAAIAAGWVGQHADPLDDHDVASPSSSGRSGTSPRASRCSSGSPRATTAARCSSRRSTAAR